MISGEDVYGLTRRRGRRGATIALGRASRPAGGLAPSQAFEPTPFLSELERFDLRSEVSDAPVTDAGRGLASRADRTSRPHGRAVSLEDDDERAPAVQPTANRCSSGWNDGYGAARTR